MRSASKVASASWIATAGSLSPVSPAASTPSSSSRSTVSSCAPSASSIASSGSETQNATLDWLVAGEMTSTSAPSTSSPSTERSRSASTGSGVRTGSFTWKPLPPGRRAQRGRRAASPQTRSPRVVGHKRDGELLGDPQHHHGEVVADLAVLHLQHGVLDVAGGGDRRAAVALADPALELLGAEAVVDGAGLDRPVGVEDQRVAGAQRQLLRADLGVGQDPEQRAGQAYGLDAPVGAQDQRQRVPARGDAAGDAVAVQRQRL